MPRLPEGHISRDAKGYYRFAKGYETANGKRRPKFFSCGRDYKRASIMQSAATEVWDYPMIAGGVDPAAQVWTPDMLARFEQFVGQRYQFAGIIRQVAAQHVEKASTLTAHAADIDGGDVEVITVATPQKVTPSTAATLHSALDAYVATVAAGPGADSYKGGIKDSMDAIKFYWADRDLATVDYAALETVTNVIKARPLSRKKTGKTFQPIKAHTVKRLLQHLRQELKWAHKQRHNADKRFGGWRMPEDGLELFGVAVDQIMTKVERDRAADGPTQISEAEIVSLYRAGIGANKTHQLWFLTALFCGQGQRELSVTRRDEFDLDAGTFAHRRNKTGQAGRYWLPPELVTLLRAHFKAAGGKGDDLAFTTREGQALVTEASDAVRQAYDDWRERCRANGQTIRAGITFYSLRRYFGDRAARIGGDSLRDAALAHTAKTVGGKHYSNYRDFQTVEAVGRAIHADLTALGMFTPLPKPKRKAKPQPVAA